MTRKEKSESHLQLLCYNAWYAHCGRCVAAPEQGGRLPAAAAVGRDELPGSGHRLATERAPLRREQEIRRLSHGLPRERDQSLPRGDARAALCTYSAMATGAQHAVGRALLADAAGFGTSRLAWPWPPRAKCCGEFRGATFRANGLRGSACRYGDEDAAGTTLRDAARLMCVLHRLGVRLADRHGLADGLKHAMALRVELERRFLSLSVRCFGLKGFQGAAVSHGLPLPAHWSRGGAVDRPLYGLNLELENTSEIFGFRGRWLARAPSTD